MTDIFFIASLIGAAVLSLIILQVLRIFASAEIARGISDLLWVLLGGIGAASAVFSYVFESDISDLQQSEIRLEIEYDSIQRDIVALLNEHCSPASIRGAQALYEGSERCGEARSVNQFLSTNRQLWTIPSTRDDVDMLREIAHSGGSRIEFEEGFQLRNTLGEEASLARERLREMRGESNFLIPATETAILLGRYYDFGQRRNYWNCFEVLSEGANGCVEVTFSTSNLGLSFFRSNTSDQFVIGYRDPLSENLDFQISRIVIMSIDFEELRSKWNLVFLSPLIEIFRQLAFILLAFAFPMRVWRSFLDLRRGMRSG